MISKKNIHIYKKGSEYIGLIKGGDIVGWLQDKINPPEMHLPGYQYCGPFTKLEKRLSRGDPGINRVDKACKKHDIKYNQNKETHQRHVADQELLEDLDSIENPTIGERIGRTIIKPIIKAKKTFGLGISSYINYKMIYCLKCKKKTETKDYREDFARNGRLMGKGNCVECGSKKNVFLDQKKS